MSVAGALCAGSVLRLEYRSHLGEDPPWPHGAFWPFVLGVDQRADLVERGLCLLWRHVASVLHSPTGELVISAAQPVADRVRAPLRALALERRKPMPAWQEQGTSA